jgi:hypothetical protein
MKWNMTSSYRRPRTTQERRYNCDEDHADFVRGKRRNIPNAWDDLPSRPHKKSRRKKGRGKKRSIVFDYYLYHEWDITSELDRQDIPYRLEYLNKNETRIIPKYRTVYTGRKITRPVFDYVERYKDESGRTRLQMKYKFIEEDETNIVKDGTREKTYSVRDKIRLTWWSDKNIGIDRILASARRAYWREKGI